MDKDSQPAIQIKTDESRLCERISLCVDPELKQLWDLCTGGARGVPEAVRAHLRKILPPIAEQIRKAEKRAG